MSEPTQGQLWLARDECPTLATSVNMASALEEWDVHRQHHLRDANDQLKRIADWLGYDITKREDEPNA